MPDGMRDIADVLLELRSVLRARFGVKPLHLHVVYEEDKDEKHPITLPFPPTPEPGTVPAVGTPSPTSTPKTTTPRHSVDFRSAHWNGQDYIFSPTQARIVKQLWEAWEDGSPEVGQETLLETADSESGRLRDLFKDHPAWGVMIVPCGKGVFRLNAG